MIEIILPSGEHLDLYSNIDISLERSNPFLSDKGSSSLPFEFPASSRNRRLLGLFGVSILEVEQKFNVILKINGLEFPALLILESFDKNKYSASILYGESLFYYKIEGITMPEVFSDYSVGTLFGRNYSVDNLIADINATSELALMYALSGDYFENNCNDYYKLSANRSDVSSSKTYKLEDEDIVALPMYRYGVHLYLQYVLKTLFKYFGFSLDLTSAPETLRFNYLVLLNNVMDLCVTGRVEYKYMVPTCSVSEFLDIIRKTFLVDFFFNYSSASFSVHSFNEVKDSIENFSSKLTSDPSFNYDLGGKISIVQEHAEMPEDREDKYIQMQDFIPSGSVLESINLGQGLSVFYSDSSASAFPILPSLRWINTKIVYNDGKPSLVEKSHYDNIYGIPKKILCMVCSCGYMYDSDVGDVEGGVSPGTDFESISRDWRCPYCGQRKDAFSLKSEPILEKSLMDLSDYGEMPIMLVYKLTYSPLPFVVYGDSSSCRVNTVYGEDTSKLIILSPLVPKVCTSNSYIDIPSDICETISDVYRYKAVQMLRVVSLTAKFKLSFFEFISFPLSSSLYINGLRCQVVSLKAKLIQDGLSEVTAELRVLFHCNP